MLVECKKYAPKRHVGLGIVQHMLGVVFDVRNIGNYGIVVTTSAFTGPAIDCAQGLEVRLAVLQVSSRLWSWRANREYMCPAVLTM